MGDTSKLSEWHQRREVSENLSSLTVWKEDESGYVQGLPQV